MCTSVATVINGRFVFGRNLDLDYRFGSGIITVPRGYPLPLRHGGGLECRFGAMGIGSIAEGYPLLAEGVNEAGLCAATLNFPTMSGYGEQTRRGALNLTPFETIPYLLACCGSIGEAEEVLRGCFIVDTPFSDKINNTKMHFHIADRSGSLAVEADGGRVRIYRNPHGTLTNAPAFPYHCDHLALFSALSPAQPEDRGELYTNGLGGWGLPGDYTSPSRFVRAAWLLGRVSAEPDGEEAAVAEVLGAVAVPRGAVVNVLGREHYTRYTSLISPASGRYTVRLHGTLSPKVIKIEKELLSGSSLSVIEF